MTDLLRRLERRAVSRLDGLRLASPIMRSAGLYGGRPGRRLSTRLARHNVRLPEGPVLVRRLGVRFLLDPRDNAQRMVYLTGSYEPGFLNFLTAELRPGDVYLDIGGHVGIDAAVAARRLLDFGEGDVFVFEPAPDCVERLKRLRADNGLRNCHIVPFAVGDAERTVVLRADPRYGAEDVGVRSIFNTGDSVAEVPMVSLDSWAAANSVDRVDVIKIDVEGSEHLVLSGASECIARFGPRVIVVEINDTRLRQAGVENEQVTKTLGSMGYVESGEVFLENVVFRPREQHCEPMSGREGARS